METLTDKGAAAGQPAPTKLTRTLHAPPAVVFEAWTSADSVKRWFAPQPYTVPEAKVDLRVGGAFEVCMRSPDGEIHWTRGTFVEIETGRRLVIEMNIDAPQGPAGALAMRALTVIEFSYALGGTLLEVTQSYTVFDPDAAAPMLAGAPIGWGMTLEQLGRVVMEMRGGGEATSRSVVHAIFNLERTYDAPAERVWKALTDEAAKQKWFGPPGNWEVIERYMDVRPGGRERAEGRWESGLVTRFDAIYHDVIANQRLVYSYEMHMDGRKISVSLATMQLKAAGGGKTTLTVTEQGAFLDGYDDAGSREHGTGLLLDTLGASLSD
jgi:uncharacterized protein YndB with AHSA1/START domain